MYLSLPVLISRVWKVGSMKAVNKLHVVYQPICMPKICNVDTNPLTRTDLSSAALQTSSKRLRLSITEQLRFLLRMREQVILKTIKQMFLHFNNEFKCKIKQE